MSHHKRSLYRILAAAAGLICVIVLTAVFQLPIYIEVLLYLAVYGFIGYDVVLEALGGIGRGQVFDENFLMVLATVGAFATGEYPEAVAVILLYQLGELFQRYAVGKSRGSIADLMELRSDTARVISDGVEIEVCPEDVEVGQIVLVKPGERVPLDGVILTGRSMVDASALTGESLPRSYGKGDEILSGVIVCNGVLEIEATKPYCDSTVSKILDMVENAAGKKAKPERYITRFARYYTPIVVSLAVLMAVIPPMADGRWMIWLKRSMNFLVISCPCALVISVPMTFFCGVGAASRIGVLVKGGSCLEQLAKTDMFVFDKTGTLTEGKFSVSQVIPEHRRKEILAAAAIAERGSIHPIACSISAIAGEGESGWVISEEPGCGVKAEKDGSVILVGNQRMMERHGIHADFGDTEVTTVYVAKDGLFLGTILISDSLKPDAAEVVFTLRKQGAETIMLTGDQEAVASEVAKRVGMSGYKAQLLPGDKVAQVEELLSRKTKDRVLAFVGDGINDAPVLMRADLGIAMGGVGSDAAIEAADIVLMHDRLSAIPAAKEIAIKTSAIVRQNIVLVLLLKLLVLVLTPFGLVSIWLAIFADVGVAVLAILNAMRAGKS